MLASLTRLLQAGGTEAHLLAAPIAVSARTGEGVDALRDLLAQVAAAKSLSRSEPTRSCTPLPPSCAPTPGRGDRARRSLRPRSGTEAREGMLRIQPGRAGSGGGNRLYRRAAGQHTGWILTRWMSRLKADPCAACTWGSKRKRRAHLRLKSLQVCSVPIARTHPSWWPPSLPPLSAAQKAGMANAVRQYSKADGGPHRRTVEAQPEGSCLSREAELPELLERDMMRIDYGLSRIRAPWVIFNTLQWIALLSALVGVGWLTLISGMAYLQIQLPPAPTPKAPRCPCRPCFCCWVYCSVSPRRVWAGCSPLWAHATTRVSCGSSADRCGEGSAVLRGRPGAAGS